MTAEETPPRTGAAPAGAEPPAPNRFAETIAAALDERRDAPRFPLREDCMVLSGTHVQQATVRDVSASGAMLHGVRGVILGDLVRLRLARMPDQPILARVRGISLLGVHLSIEDGTDREIWQAALRDVLG